jgi:hypothetical protein
VIKWPPVRVGATTSLPFLWGHVACIVVLQKSVLNLPKDAGSRRWCGGAIVGREAAALVGSVSLHAKGGGGDELNAHMRRDLLLASAAGCVALDNLRKLMNIDSVQPHANYTEIL